MAVCKAVDLAQVASHPWQSLSAEVHLGCEEYVRRLITRFTPNDEKELHWMLDHKVLSIASLNKMVTGMILVNKVNTDTKVGILAARLRLFMSLHGYREQNFSKGAEELYFRFTIIPADTKFLAFVQGEEMYGEAVMHGEGRTEFEALKSLVAKLEDLAPKR